MLSKYNGTLHTYTQFDIYKVHTAGYQCDDNIIVELVHGNFIRRWIAMVSTISLLSTCTLAP